MLDLFLIASLGFLGSFGHCAGMCGPITAAFALTGSSAAAEKATLQQLRFHLLLNLGRILSYVLVGASIGAIGSVLVAGGQMAGIGSLLRRGMAVVTGLLLIGFGLAQIGILPHLPFLHPLAAGKLHQRLSSSMVKLSLAQHSWTPFLLGLVWGLIPCGFLYTAQIKAAETANLGQGMATMLAFGLGTLPLMLGVGLSASLVSADRRSQLFRMGGWITLTIGILTLLRTGDTMVDYTGHVALICLLLAMAARPLSRLWAAPLQYRRALGLGAFILSVAHMAHMAEHSWGWNWDAVFFMLPQHQIAIALGLSSLILLLPAAVTSFDGAQKKLGKVWRSLHLLSLPALLLAVTHTLLIGSHYLGAMQIARVNQILAAGLGAIVVGVLLLRQRWIWKIFSLEKFYVSPYSVQSTQAKSSQAKSTSVK
ncbi:MAG TPA: sulfite exporter TauE/SafE family protein [Coleofasciculaceae cyanobacterium]|jgi:hypothetical protein